MAVMSGCHFKDTGHCLKTKITVISALDAESSLAMKKTGNMAAGTLQKKNYVSANFSGAIGWQNKGIFFKLYLPTVPVLPRKP